MNRPSEFKTWGPDDVEAMLSDFLMDSWSYSKVASFARNEKAFEMQYIYGYKARYSATTAAGTAYHQALCHFFNRLKEGETVDMVGLETIAFNYINDVPANEWKIQKTTPTVESCIIKATATVSNLLKNFLKEVSTYTDEIGEILDVELYCDEWVVINGVDIPLPCHAMIDLVFRSKSGKIVIVDHKTKQSYTSEEEMAMSIGNQAITYINVFESKIGIKVDEVWFVENKFSSNKDGSPQLRAFKLELNEDTRKLYEALLYEPLRKMISAVNDPDYTYVINDSDNYIDRAELYDFWAKTMISEVEDFNVSDAKRDLVSKRLKKIRDVSISTVNPKVIQEFKKNASAFIQYDLSNKNMKQEEKIEHVLRSFGVIVQVAHKFEGFSSNTYLLEISSGIKVSSIQSHKLDIANALDVNTVRISKELVMHDSKSYLAVEFSKKSNRILYWDKNELKGKKIPIGKDNFNNTIIWDLENHSTPHLLVCGATGSGKSVLVRSNVEYALQAGIDAVTIFDPKYEFTEMKKIPDVQVYNDILKIEDKMAALVEEMNILVKEGSKKMNLIVFDEFADALSASRQGNQLNIYEHVTTGYYATGMPKTKREVTGRLKSLEENLKILLQKGRSSGFRIIAATQRASTKVITGDAKVNFPVQICFRVPKETDSRVVIDESGAEGLAGMGDGLIRSPEYPDIIRFQGFFKA